MKTELTKIRNSLYDNITAVDVSIWDLLQAIKAHLAKLDELIDTPEPLSISVTNCLNCPFCNNDNEFGFSCNFPKNEVQEYGMSMGIFSPPPEKCPLKNHVPFVKLVSTTQP